MERSVWVLAFLFSLLLGTAQSQISISSNGLPSTPTFSATYIKSNPSFFGFGLVSGDIKYDGSSRSMVLTDSMSAGSVTNYLSFSASGAGTYKYEPSCVGYGASSCEVTDISSMAFWVLWLNPDYYNTSPVPDGFFAGCSRYNKKAGSVTSTTANYVTSLWLKANGDVCGWEMANGDRYTVTSFTRGASVPAAPSTCTSPSASTPTCYKPLNLVFIVDQNGPATLADINTLKTQLATLANSLAISPQIINTYLLTIAGTSVATANPPLGTNTAQFSTQINSAFSCTGSTTCNAGYTNSVPTAITNAANLIASSTTPYRPNTETAIVFITWGGFSNSAAQINTALTQASTTIGAKTSGTSSLPFSKVVSFNSVVINNNTALNLLQGVASTNTQNQVSNIRLNPYSNITSYPASTDSLYNNAWGATSTATMNSVFPQVAAGLCATNGLVSQSRSCAGCCGDCACGVQCIQPDSCPQQPCFNQSLTKAVGAPDSALCCTLLPQCPGFTTSGCNFTFCNTSNGVCSYITPTCPSIAGFPTNCYDRVCDPAQSTTSTLVCKSVAKFNATVNACYQRVCNNATNQANVVPKITCPTQACATVACDNSTGNCNTTPLPVPTPSAADQCKDVKCDPTTNRTYIFVFPAACTASNTNKCKVPQCVGSSCVLVDKCTPDTCTNYTCDPTVGTCVAITCPPYGTFANGTQNKCIKAPACTATSGPALAGCSLTPVVCPNSSNPCVPNTCVNGNCVPTTLCPSFETTSGVQNLCRPLVTSSCTTGTCQYTNLVCNDPTKLAADPGCVNTTCDPKVGCAYNIPCPYVKADQCGYRANNATCLTGSCTYSLRVCPTRSDPCENRTCVPGTGCPTTYPTLCAINQNGNKCLIRNNATCDAVRQGTATTCSYTGTVCNSPDPCAPQGCFSNNGSCSTNFTLTCGRLRTTGPVCQQLNTGACNGQGNCVYGNVRDCNTGVAWITGACTWNTTTNTTICANTTLCARKACFNIVGYNASAPAASRCQYAAIDCSPISTGSPCTKFQCNPVDDTCSIQVSNCANSTTNLCNYTTTCSGNCVYQSVTCPAPSTNCNITTCNPSTGRCAETVNCPNINCYTRSCPTAGSCQYTPTNACVNTNPCNQTVCLNSTGACSSTIVCPQFQVVGGQTRYCSYRTGCGTLGSPTCIYQLNTTCTPRDNCETAACNNNTINSCTYTDVSVTNSRCALFNDTNKCFRRDNTTCSTAGACGYVPVILCNTPANYPPCKSLVCQNGACVNQTNTNYQCPPNADACLINSFSATSPTCCVASARCTPFVGNNKCQPQSCVYNASVAGGASCVVAPVQCPADLSASGDACTIANVGGACDTTTGNCTKYSRLTCPPQDACTNILCDNTTGKCSIPSPNPSCSAACLALNCPSVQNCTYYDCIVSNVTGKASCLPRTQTAPGASQFCTDRAAGDYCTVGTCVSGQFCVTTYKDITYCNTTYSQQSGIKLPPCSRWTLNPNDPNCCSAVPNCNTGVDPNYQCMLTACSTDGVTCTLVDNTDAVCPPFQFGNKCFPRQSCNNATGTCSYYDLTIECAVNQSKIDPCYDGVCNPTTGACEARVSNRCALGSLCINTNCQFDKCVQNVCDPATGNCTLQGTTNCGRLDNCTDQRCDPVVGCVPVPFDPSLCNSTDPCKILVLNGSIPGCCSFVDKCPPPADPECQTGTCTASGQCVYDDVSCATNEVNLTTQQVNYCKNYLTCAGGCKYTDTVCNVSYPGVPCFQDVCNPATGQCSVVDTCPKDRCVQQTCNPVSKQCEVTKTLVCPTNLCTQQVCDPILACKIINDTALSSCKPGPCQTPFLNPNKPGCCDYIDYCTSNDPCVLAICNTTSNKCDRTPFCPSTKCNDTVCTVVSGAATCTSTPKACIPASQCEVVEPCVEDAKPFACVTHPLCGRVQPADVCLQEICVENATGAFCETIRNPALTCDDSDPCTSNDCVNGTCVNINCPTDDPCVPGTCTNGTCVYAPFPCDDNNLCTNDTCVLDANGKATCTHPAVICPETDFCLVQTCSPATGCVSSARYCLLNESCLFIDSDGIKSTAAVCSDSVCAKSSSSVYIDCATKKQNDNVPTTSSIAATNCDVYQCTNGTCTYEVRKCPNTLTIVAITTGIGAAVIAGIIIAVIACVGLSGGAVLAVANRANFGDNANIMNNPLFKPSQTSFENPLNSANRT